MLHHLLFLESSQSTGARIVQHFFHLFFCQLLSAFPVLDRASLNSRITPTVLQSFPNSRPRVPGHEKWHFLGPASSFPNPGPKTCQFPVHGHEIMLFPVPENTLSSSFKISRGAPPFHSSSRRFYLRCLKCYLIRQVAHEPVGLKCWKRLKQRLWLIAAPLLGVVGVGVSKTPKFKNI